VTTWACPRCRRRFRQVNQRHACGVGRADIAAGRPPALAALYARLRATVVALGGVEVVERDRYALFRTTRIFADLQVMTDALRLAIHLRRQADDPRWIKVQGDPRGRVAHVALLRTATDLRAVAAYLREAHALTLDEPVTRAPAPPPGAPPPPRGRGPARPARRPSSRSPRPPGRA
jgi:hypothetical protein